MDVDPVTSGEQLPKHKKGVVGSFAPSRSWAFYNRLNPIDVGYLVPVYSLADIAKRYGLTQNSTRYFRKHILPEPFDIVRRRSVNAHHWSRFVLMAMDVVLKDLEAKGYDQFLKRFDDHVDLIDRGAEWMADYYADRQDDYAIQSDEFGVTWL